jgi:hypothetical protein
VCVIHHRQNLSEYTPFSVVSILIVDIRRKSLFSANLILIVKLKREVYQYRQTNRTSSIFITDESPQRSNILTEIFHVTHVVTLSIQEVYKMEEGSVVCKCNAPYLSYNATQSCENSSEPWKSKLYC